MTANIDGTTGIDKVQDNATVSGTGGFTVPSGTTAQRPGSPTTGVIRYNTDESSLETYNGTSWLKVDTSIFTYSVEYLVIAGGGGGGSNGGSGGGAGGYRSSVSGENSGGGASAESPLTLTEGTTYTITIGAGGTDSRTFAGYATGASGNNSVFDSITSIGGGRGAYGGSNNDTVASGGSGGGASRYNTYGTLTGGAGTSGQGYAGGNGFNTGNYFQSGGGGGAGGVGGNASGTTNNIGGVGGAGVSSSITGSATTRASGGSGYNQGTATPGGGGATGNNATANTGGGGGTNANGGSGVVILRMPTLKYSGTTTGSPTVTTDGTDTILTYTSSGSYTA